MEIISYWKSAWGCDRSDYLYLISPFEVVSGYLSVYSQISCMPTYRAYIVLIALNNIEEKSKLTALVELVFQPS